MSIFDYTELNKQKKQKEKQQAEVTAAAHKKSELLEHRKKTLMSFIVQCLKDFPVMARKMKLKTKEIRTSGFLWTTVKEVWVLNEYNGNIVNSVGLDGVYYRRPSRYGSSNYIPIQVETMAERIYLLLGLYSDGSNCIEQTLEEVKIFFNNALLDQPLSRREEYEY